MVKRELVDRMFVKDFGDTEEDIYIVFLGDMHLGAPGFMQKEFQAYLDWAAESDNHYIIGMGDYLECATLLYGRLKFDARPFCARRVWEFYQKSNKMIVRRRDGKALK